ncbi:MULTISPECIES: hypothetical protein [Pelosinus]|uniref:Uncharacterized protein n=1 Tax=Pelosinus fermentans B4 TaxID=1149862 RepID=I8RM11_9FIRM|nr:MULTISPECIES: hypothetical protein [Pelosinus]EIW19750.1 hypothetical protein FB4_0001 [Pelosinus fermentans B4]EIW21393.1 hypothetical protein FA11_1120 [Pelosinus fermentans A11]OAM94903.1 hypothetical protein FR7_02924 [Pelosinus fermentans DSM 17108]SDR20032.1 hypothetical protein SAMN04515679_3053 [Pelosinus fermentans]
MTLENSVMVSAMIVVLVSGMDLIISSDIPLNTSIMVSSMELLKISGIIVVARLLAKE